MANSVRSRMYFKYGHILHFVLVFVGFYLLWKSVYTPDSIPWYFGPLSNVATYLGKNYNEIMKITLYIAIFLHVLESLIAVVISRKYNLNWTCTIAWGIQTFLIGFLSLKILLKYDVNHKGSTQNVNKKTK